MDLASKGTSIFHLYEMLTFFFISCKFFLGPSPRFHSDMGVSNSKHILLLTLTMYGDSLEFEELMEHFMCYASTSKSCFRLEGSSYHPWVSNSLSGRRYHKHFRQEMESALHVMQPIPDACALIDVESPLCLHMRLVSSGLKNVLGYKILLPMEILCESFWTLLHGFFYSLIDFFTQHFAHSLWQCLLLESTKLSSYPIFTIALS